MIRVLIVDDQDLARAGLRTLLEVEPDFDVVGEARNGREAVSQAEVCTPDVILMDVSMPEMDGITATITLRDAGHPARVCVLTTFGLEEYVFDAIHAGASGFLVKTDHAETIVATVRAVAAGEFALGGETTAQLVARFAGGPRPRAGQDPLAVLTAREREVFLLMAEGLSNAEIAERLFVGEGTVKTHVSRVLMKLGLRDRVQAVILAYSSGLAP